MNGIFEIENKEYALSEININSNFESFAGRASKPFLIGFIVSAITEDIPKLGKLGTLKCEGLECEAFISSAIVSKETNLKSIVLLTHGQPSKHPAIEGVCLPAWQYHTSID